MRRTSLMVLVLALVFAGAAATPSTAQTSPVRPKHKSAHAPKSGASQTSRSKTGAARASRAKTGLPKAGNAAAARRTSRASAHRRAAAPSRPAPYRAGRRIRGSARRTRAWSQTASLTRPRSLAPSSPQRQPRSTPGVPVEAASLAASPAPTQFIGPPAHPLARGAMPPPLRGSLVSLERQNAMADAEGLERIEDEADLSDRIAHGLLVPVPVSASLAINGNLPEHHRYCRPWTARFLADLSSAFAAEFRGGVLEVSSAVRTVAYQKRLMGVNGNAAPAVGDIVSPHLTGATIDIAKHGLTAKQIGWMRAWLLPLQDAGKLDVEEEFQQACFHITVYKGYVAPRPPMSIARTRAPRSGTGQPGTLQATPAQPGNPQPGGPQVKPAMAIPGAAAPAQGHVRPAMSDLASAAPTVSR